MVQEERRPAMVKEHSKTPSTWKQPKKATTWMVRSSSKDSLFFKKQDVAEGKRVLLRSWSRSTPHETRHGAIKVGEVKAALAVVR